MKINNRKELYNYLNNLDYRKFKDSDMSSVYFLITYDDMCYPVHFQHFNKSYFESPCELRKRKCSKEELNDYINLQYEPEFLEKATDYEFSMYKNGYHYEIDNFQCLPYLKYLENIQPLTEQECLNWLIEHEED